jgi:hypothetical protein
MFAPNTSTVEILGNFIGVWNKWNKRYEKRTATERKLKENGRDLFQSLMNFILHIL